MNDLSWKEFFELYKEQDTSNDQCTGENCPNLGRHIFNDDWLCNDCFKRSLEDYLDHF